MATSPSNRVHDVAVVGAGPAGMAAAITAADAGLTVAVLDLADRVGGQYYRHPPPRLAAGDPGAFHHGWATFARLRERFKEHARAGRLEHLPGHAVWSVDRRNDFVVRATEGERERRGREVAARALVVATGAYDRQIPFPGWTLPGVVAAGGAQALLKGSRVAAGRRAVVGGTGPFLLSVADGLLAAGVEVAAVVEASAPWRYTRRPRAVAGAWPKIPEAVGYAAHLLRHRVPYRVRHAVTAAHGETHLEAVTISRVDAHWRPIAGSERRVSCDAVAVGYGFTPQLDLLAGLDCATAVSIDGSLVASVDGEQRTSVDGVYAAGETTGVGGADLAIVEGTLAGAAAGRALGGRPPIDERTTRRLWTRRARLQRFADLLQEANPLRDGWTGWLDDTTLVCRCEDVSYARMREAVRDLGATEARTVKLLARPGMGWCQGRICGSATATLTAHLLGRAATRQDVEGLTGRTIAQPVPLDALAALDGSTSGEKHPHFPQ